MRRYTRWASALLMAAMITFTSCQRSATPSSSRPNTTESSSTMSSEDSKRTNIARDAEELQGIKYVYGGTTTKGFDCSGFTSYIMDQNGITIPRTSRAQAEHGSAVSLKDAKKGDLLFFKKGGKVFHVALILDNSKEGLTVIHATSSKGIMIENVSISSYWKDKIGFARRVI